MTVSGIHGTGDLRLDLVDNSSIEGTAGVLGGPAGVGAHPIPNDNHDRTIVVRLTRDAVLIDYRLDERENGLDVARKIRATWNKTVDVVLMTAETDADIFEAAGECGILVLRKPIKPIRLRALVTAPALGAGGG